MKQPSLAAAYLYLVPLLTEVAHEHGYAIAVHGTLARDLDILAAPWVDEASSPADLVAALYARVCSYAWDQQEPMGPTSKPHGRLAWTILLGGGAFIDLSVMPRQGTA